MKGLAELKNKIVKAPHLNIFKIGTWVTMGLFATYIQAEKILLDNIDELRENMYNYIYKIKRRLREIKE